MTRDSGAVHVKRSRLPSEAAAAASHSASLLHGRDGRDTQRAMFRDNVIASWKNKAKSRACRARHFWERVSLCQSSASPLAERRTKLVL